MRKTLIVLFVLILNIFVFIPKVAAAPDTSYTANEIIPRIILTKYDIGANKILGGSSFDLIYTLRNTGSTDVRNILVTLQSDSNAYVPIVGKSNQIYIAEIAAGKEYSDKIKLSANSVLLSDMYNITFFMQYQDRSNTAYTTTAQINFPMEQQQKLSINDLNFPQTCVNGSRALLNVSYKNPGKTDLKNVSMKLNGDLSTDEKKVDIGTVTAGTSGYVDKYITLQKSGTQTISISFTYEDADGNVFSTDERNVSVLVKDGDLGSTAVDNAANSTPSGNTQNTPEAQVGRIAMTSMNSLLLVFAAFLMIITIVVIIIVVAAKKRKKTGRTWENKDKQ